MTDKNEETKTDDVLANPNCNGGLNALVAYIEEEKSKHSETGTTESEAAHDTGVYNGLQGVKKKIKELWPDLEMDI